LRYKKEAEKEKREKALYENSEAQIEKLEIISQYMIQQAENLELQNQILNEQVTNLKLQNEKAENQIEKIEKQWYCRHLFFIFAVSMGRYFR